MADIIPVNSTRLVRLEEACHALAEAKSIEDVKAIRDHAQLFADYARERGYGRQAVNDAVEIKIRAERRMGELIPALFPHGGNRSDSRSHTVTLKDHGLNRMDSSRAQQITSIPELEFESHIIEVRSKGGELTTASFLRLAKEIHQPGKQDKPPLGDGCAEKDLHKLIRDGRKFGTIYADPPWSYSNQATRASTDNHYQTMSVADIAALPVNELAADYCHLHLWTTNAFLRDSFDLVEKWGFLYQGVFVWCKPQMGIGNCWRVSHEFLMLAIRGEPRKFAVHNLKSWAELDRDQHSAKPGLVREWIEQASPPDYLELFARIPWHGWTTWGNEIPRDELFGRNESSTLEAS